MEKNKKKYKRRYGKKRAKRGKVWKWLFVVIGLLGIIGMVFCLMKGKETENKGVDGLPQVQNIDELTWEEYQALTPEEKALIPDMFENMEEYNAWYESLDKNDETQLEIDALESDEKNAKEFTWEEYQELTIDEKAIFPDYFDTFEEYKQWYDATCPNE